MVNNIMEFILALMATASISIAPNKVCVDGVRGEYHNKTQEIKICKDAEVDTLVHELGHHLRHHYMKQSERDKYTELFGTGYFAISKYSMANEREDFAEMFKYTMLGKLKDIQLLQPKTIYVQSMIDKYSIVLSDNK